MSRINLVTYPVKDNNPKVWHDGQWKNAKDVDVVLLNGGELDPTILPREARVANAPTHSPDLSWHSGDVVYRNDKLYRANSDIPEGVAFKEGDLAQQWKPVSITDQIPNVPEFNVYNPGLDKQIKAGELFFDNGILYRAKLNSIGVQVNSPNYFDKLGGFVMPPAFTTSKTHLSGEIVKLHGYYVAANSDIPAGTSFAWGLPTQLNTWRPVIYNGFLQYNWRGVVSSTSTYAYGDVVSVTDRSIALYVCIAVSANGFSVETTPDSSWTLLVNDTPLILSQYSKKTDDVVVNDWAVSHLYAKGTIVKYTDGKYYSANAVIPPNTPWAPGLWTEIVDTSGFATKTEVELISDQMSLKQNIINGAASTITLGNLATNSVVITDANGKIAANSNVSATEVSYLDGVTSNIQTQLNGKQNTINGAASTITTANLATNSVVITDGNGKIAVNSNISGTEVSYLDGVTSNIQTQLNNKMDKTHVTIGYDLVQSAQPRAVFRDKFLTSGPSNTTVSWQNVPWIYANIDQAERSLPYWIQQLATFFKNFENDNQFDQLIGGIPANFSIPFGSWGVAPSGSTDMDNAILSASGNYGAEVFEFIVGRSPSGNEIYTFQFTFALQTSGPSDASGAMYPFRMIYQTGRNQSTHNWSGTVVGAIASSVPRCTARPSSFTTGTYNASSFPLMYEPITLEISK
ncbi:hypothetical protein OPFAMLBM_00027 [Aeromonas phage avDM12-TAAL]|nr:hypothetical protein OPFAMLBM_00027 [Aeromonas phage avDM12-TAAL]